MIKNIREMAVSVRQRIEACRSACGDDLEAQHEWYDNDAETVQLRKLMSVYYGALEDPPDGVIGVGAITYAEMKLVEAQKGS